MESAHRDEVRVGVGPDTVHGDLVVDVADKTTLHDVLLALHRMSMPEVSYATTSHLLELASVAVCAGLHVEVSAMSSANTARDLRVGVRTPRGAHRERRPSNSSSWRGCESERPAPASSR